MNNLTVTLDTTPPVVSIIAPKYAMADDIVHITIEANEALDSWNNIRIVDNNDIDISNTFTMYENSFIGSVHIPTGINKITIYAQLRDDVWNMSDIISKTVDILTGKTLKIVSINEIIMNNDISDLTRLLKPDNHIMNNKTTSIIPEIKSEVIFR